MDGTSKEVRFEPQPKQMIALSSPADIVIYGGARGGGKSYALALCPLRHIQHQNFSCVLFRRTYPEVVQEGGLWDTTEKIYPFAGATGSVGKMEWRFPSGACVRMSHMANPMDWQGWLGSQIPFMGFDQLETFTEKQFWSMLACSRDPNGILNPYVWATCNPEPDTWLSRFIQWWWDEDTGYPIEERSGKMRWFVRISDTLYWSDDRQELVDEFPEIPPKSVCFVASFVDDNQALVKADPSYKANLLAQGIVEKERWLKGNWKIKATAGTIFNRAWFSGKVLSEMPAEFIGDSIRFWDMAATPASEKKDPDWTAGVKIVRWGMNKFIITDVRRFRKTPYENEQEIELAASIDGIECAVRMEEEGGSSGISLVSHYMRNVMMGYNFAGVKSQKKKIIRWAPLSKAIQAGCVFLLKGDWNTAFIDELDACRGEDEKNDQADAASGAFNELNASGGTAEAIDHRGEGFDRTKQVRFNRKRIL